jgi:hypothetical protein
VGDDERVRAVAARSAAVDAQGVDGLAGERLHRPAMQLEHGAGDHRRRG